MNEAPQQSRVGRIVSVTIRSVVAILILYTGLQAILIFRELGQSASRKGEENTDHQIAEDNFALIQEDQLFQGQWLFESLDGILSTGMTDSNGMKELLTSFQAKYQEQQVVPQINLGNLIHFFAMVNKRNPTSEPGKIIRKFFVNPNHQEDPLLVVGVEVQPDQYWYLYSEPAKQQKPADFPSENDLTRFTMDYKTFARKFDDRGNVVLRWAQAGSAVQVKRQTVLQQWENDQIKFDLNFPEFPDRFDYTCRFEETSVRMLGICQGDLVTDLIVIRL